MDGCNGASAATLRITRGGQVRTIHITPRYDGTLKRMRLGFSFDFGYVEKSVPEWRRASPWAAMWRVTRETVKAIGRAVLLVRKARKDVSGVVGSYEVTRESFSFDTAQALNVLAIVSLSLAVINLFPFLPLDGGHIFWALAEKVRGRPIPFSVIERASAIGFLLVIFLFVIGLSNDIGRLRGEGFGLRQAFDRGSREGGAQWRARSRARGERRDDRRGVPDHRRRARPTRSRSAPRTTRSRSPGASCASASTRSPAGSPRSASARGDTLALMLANRPEFHLCDLAAMMLGATPFSIYSTYTPEQIRYLVTDADARILICEQQYLPQVLEAREELPELEHVIVIDGEAPEGTLALAEVEGSNPDFDVEASRRRIERAATC